MRLVNAAGRRGVAMIGYRVHSPRSRNKIFEAYSTQEPLMIRCMH